MNNLVRIRGDGALSCEPDDRLLLFVYDFTIRPVYDFHSHIYPSFMSFVLLTITLVVTNLAPHP